MDSSKNEITINDLLDFSKSNSLYLLGKVGDQFSKVAARFLNQAIESGLEESTILVVYEGMNDCHLDIFFKEVNKGLSSPIVKNKSVGRSRQDDEFGILVNEKFYKVWVLKNDIFLEDEIKGCVFTHVLGLNLEGNIMADQEIRSARKVFWGNVRSDWIYNEYRYIQRAKIIAFGNKAKFINLLSREKIEFV